MNTDREQLRRLGEQEEYPLDKPTLFHEMGEALLSHDPESGPESMRERLDERGIPEPFRSMLVRAVYGSE